MGAAHERLPARGQAQPELSDVQSAHLRANVQIVPKRRATPEGVAQVREETTRKGPLGSGRGLIDR